MLRSKRVRRDEANRMRRYLRRLIGELKIRSVDGKATASADTIARMKVLRERLAGTLWCRIIDALAPWDRNTVRMAVRLDPAAAAGDA